MRDVIEQIPPPEAIKERLGHALREATLLRRLLRVSELKGRLNPNSGDAAEQPDDKREAINHG